MSIPVYSAAGGNHGGGSSLSWSHVTADESDRLLLVGTTVFAGADQHVTDVTYDSVALTRLLRLKTGSSEGDLWYLVAPNTGTHTVVATANFSAASFAGVSVGYRNVHQTTPFGNTGTVGGTAGPMTQDVSSATDELVIDVLAFIVTSGVTVGGGQTQRGQQLETATGTAMSEEAGAATVTMSWSPIGTIVSWNSLVASLRGPSVAGGIVFNLQIG